MNVCVFPFIDFKVCQVWFIFVQSKFTVNYKHQSLLKRYNLDKPCWFEPCLAKLPIMTFEPNEDSDQPLMMHSLIRVKKPWILKTVQSLGLCGPVVKSADY